MRIIDVGNDIIIEGHLYTVVCNTIGGSTIKLYEDDTYVTSTTTDENGYFKFIIPTSTVGERNFKLIYEGDSNYTGSESATIEVTVRNAPTLDEIILTSDVELCQLGERFHLSGVCESQYEDNLAGVQVQLKLNGETVQTQTSDSNGAVSFKFTPSEAGTYTTTLSSGNITSNSLTLVVVEGNIYEIIADLSEFPGSYTKDEIDAMLLALKNLLEAEKSDVGHTHNISDVNNLQALLDDRVTWEAFYDRGGSNVDIVTSWGSPTSNAKVPSEKLVKNSLDAKSDTGHTHDDRYYTESEMNTALAGKQDTLVSGTNIKTINYESILGSGNINIQGGGGGGSYLNDFYGDSTTNELIIDYTNTTGSEVVTSWSSTPTDIKVPSEKLVKDTFDDILDLVYPVGSIYMSVNSTSPATLFGGTWEQVKDRFLLSAGDTYTNGNTGGEATHTLTTDEMPSHKHMLKIYNHDNSGTVKNVNRTIWSSQTDAGVLLDTETTGNGVAHNNMPPYLVVNVWKRTG